MSSTKKSKSKSKSKTLSVPPRVHEAWEWACAARRQAYAPYSKFRVGAAIIDDRDQIHQGCNVENASYGATVCAERVATFRAVTDGARKIRHVVVVTDTSPPASPCALCLQVLAEFSDKETLVWIADVAGICERVALNELLPRQFGPQELKTGLTTKGSKGK